MKRSILTFLLIAPLILNAASCEKQEKPTQKEQEGTEQPDTPPEEEEPKPELTLVAPEDGATLTLSFTNSYSFSWNNLPKEDFYRLYFSLDAEMSNPVKFNARTNPFELSGNQLQQVLEQLGAAEGESRDIWWSVGPFDEAASYQREVRKLTVTLPQQGIHEPNADPIKVKVAVVIEDPVFNNPSDPNDVRNGKRIHEIEGWNDPHKQMLEYKADFEEISYGVVDIEIVEVHQSEKMFCYTRSTKNSAQREYMTPALLYERYFNPDPANNKAHIDIDGKDLEYDYVAMMDEFGLSAKVDAGTINEVWVYNHPACHMNESRFMGEKGFWCNSYPINYGTGRDAAHHRKLVCVMFCNYERTVDLALHSFAHRVESIMSQLNYNNYWGFPNNTYSKYGVFTYVYDYAGFSGKEEDLIPFDMFFSHGKAYSAVGAPGYAHIGTCHCPCNTNDDYIYWDKNSIYTFADEWLNYPYIYCDRSKARKVTSDEWGGNQYGYMKWFYRHIPHFKGLNTYDKRDLHLNNWWHYLFDYYGALQYEARLRDELDK